MQEKKKIYFNVSARTARLIGQENFANAEGAVIELVKTHMMQMLLFVPSYLT